MKITESAVKHPITTFMFFTAMFVLGIISLSRLGLELFPDITYPTAAVITLDPGVGPYEIESQISKPIEDTVSTINGVEQVSSTSGEGISFVTINFTWGTNMDTIVSEIREKLTDIENDLPDDAQRPMIFRFNPEILPSIQINVESTMQGIDLRKFVEKRIVPELEKIKGVATAEVYGGKISAVTCKLHLDEISKVKIPITQILKVFQGENVDLPAGSIRLKNKYLVLRTIGSFKQLKDIGNVLIGYNNNVPVYLKDVADIKLGYLPQEEYVLSGGHEGVLISVRKQPGHNTVEVIDNVKKTLKRIEKTFPSSIHITTQSDQSKSIIRALGGVASAAWQGGLLAVLILLFFLRNIGSTLIISVAIPVSVITTFSLMDFGHITMNIMSLAGITLGIGMLVDNAIVVLESNYRKQLAGYNSIEAAISGTEEVAMAISASTLTTVAVFVPLIFVKGITGLIFRDLAYTISFALFVSLAMALTLMPVLCSKFLHVSGIITKPPKNLKGTSTEETKEISQSTLSSPSQRSNHDNKYEELSLADVEIHTGNKLIDAIGKKIQRWLKELDNFYERALKWALTHASTVIITATVLLILSIGSIKLLGMEFLPETDEGKFSISFETGIGSPYKRTMEKVGEAERLIKQTLGSDLKSISSSIGTSGSLAGIARTGSHLAVIMVTLVDKDKRKRSIWQIINLLDKKLKENIVDAKFTTRIEGMSSLASSATGEMEPIVLEIAGDNLDNDYKYARRIEKIVSSVRGTRDTQISYTSGKPELQFIVKRKEAISLGLSPLEIAATLRTVFKGTKVSKFRKGEDTYDILLTVRDRDKDTMAKIKNLFFVNRVGTKIPLENVVDIKKATGPLVIDRLNRTRMIKVTSNLSGERALSRITADIKQRIKEDAPTPPGITLTMTGSSKQMEESFHSLVFALLLAIALVYMVMASQFESFIHPFIIMFSVPFAIVGLTVALLITNTTFSLVAFIGGIVLVGIVVNNAIVLIDYINTLRKRGYTLEEAIVHGGKTRLKPILMTTSTTVLGLLPMALGLGTGAELRAPMARAVVGGLTTSTLITLILIPTIYWIVEAKIKGRKNEI